MRSDEIRKRMIETDPSELLDTREFCESLQGIQIDQHFAEWLCILYDTNEFIY